MVKKIVGLLLLGGLLVGILPARTLAAPQIFIGGVTDATYYNRPVTVLYGTSEGRAAATLNNLSFTSGSTVGSEGVYSLLVVAIPDNGPSTSRSLFFGIDTTSPVITINGVSDGQATTSSVVPTFSANEGTVSATLNGGSFLSGQTVSGAGSYQLRVQATDKASNQTVRTLGFTINSVPTPPAPTPIINNTTTTTETTKETVKETIKEVAASQPTITAPQVSVPKVAQAAAKRTVKKVAVAPSKAVQPSVDDLLKQIQVDSILNIDDGNRPLDSCSPVRIIGQAQSGWFLTLFIKKAGSDEVILGVVQVGPDGQWTFSRDKAFEPANYTLLGQLETQDGKFGPKIALRDFRVAQCGNFVVAKKALNLIWLWWILAGIILVLIILFLVWLLLKRKRRGSHRLGEETP